MLTGRGQDEFIHFELRRPFGLHVDSVTYLELYASSISAITTQTKRVGRLQVLTLCIAAALHQKHSGSFLSNTRTGKQNGRTEYPATVLVSPLELFGAQNGLEQM